MALGGVRRHVVDAGEVRRRVGAQEGDHAGRRLRAGQERLPRRHVLGPVDIAAGHARQPLARHPREDVVAVHELVPVDQVAHVRGVGVDAARRAAGRRVALLGMRMGGDDGGARGAGLRHRRPRPAIDPDEPAQAHRDGVDGPIGIHVGVGQLEPWHHQQPVVAQRPLGHRVDGLEVRGVGARVDRVGRVGRADHMVGDAEHVESPRAVEVDQVIEAELAVAPRGVRVQLAQERAAAGWSGSGGHTRRVAAVVAGGVTARRNAGDDPVSPERGAIRLSLRRRYGKTIRMIPDYQLFIGGEWVDAVSGESFETVDPATGAAWARVPEAGAADVDAAVRAARAALADPAWSDLTPAERGRLLRRLADILRRDAEELAILESTDNGKLLRETRAQCAAIADHIDYFAGAADKVEGAVIPSGKANFLVYTQAVPVGVVGLLLPWNSPLFLTTFKLAPALAAGCTVVIKPSEATPVTALELGRRIARGGVPGGRRERGHRQRARSWPGAHRPSGRRQDLLHRVDAHGHRCRQERDRASRARPTSSWAGSRRTSCSRTRISRRRRTAWSPGSSPPRARPASPARAWSCTRTSGSRCSNGSSPVPGRSSSAIPRIRRRRWGPSRPRPSTRRSGR